MSELQESLKLIIEKLKPHKFDHMVYVGKDYSKDELIKDLEAVIEDGK